MCKRRDTIGIFRLIAYGVCVAGIMPTSAFGQSGEPTSAERRERYVPSYARQWVKTESENGATSRSELGEDRKRIERFGELERESIHPNSAAAASLRAARHDLGDGLIEIQSTLDVARGPIESDTLTEVQQDPPSPRSPSDRRWAGYAREVADAGPVDVPQNAEETNGLLLPEPSTVEGTATDSVDLPAYDDSKTETEEVAFPMPQELYVEELPPMQDAASRQPLTTSIPEPSFGDEETPCDCPPALEGHYTQVPDVFTNRLERPAIVFQPAVPGRDSGGRQILRPQVRVAEDGLTSIPPNPIVPIAPAVPLEESRIPIQPSVSQTPTVPPRRTLGLGDRLSRFRERRRRPLESAFDAWMRNRQPVARDSGVGVERLPFALFEMDASQPQNHFRLRFESGYNWENPDRTEFLWSKLGGRGPASTTPPESSVDYQDVRLISEIGSDKFSVTTELPLRFVNPTVLGNTGGFGDMVLTTKTVLFTGKQFQMTQVLRNQLATGASASGRGTGHASMEPGFLFRYQRSCDTMLHSELKLRFPIAGDPDHSGPVLRYGFGMARLLHDTDTFAIIPTFEMVGWSVLSGRETVPSELLGIAEVNNLDGLNIFNLYPGVRFVRDAGGDLGVFELGVSGGITVTDRHWYESMIRMDIAFGF